MKNKKEFCQWHEEMETPAECSMKPTITSKPAAHTPTPWKQSGPYIIGQNDLSVAKCTVYKGTNEAKDIENENQAKANAAFIVRACNNFQNMLTAMRVIKASLDKKKYGERKEGELEGYFNLCDAITEAEK